MGWSTESKQQVVEKVPVPGISIVTGGIKISVNNFPFTSLQSVAGSVCNCALFVSFLHT